LLFPIDLFDLLNIYIFFKKRI